ncbi:MAG: type II toxin-antitoxin system VapB family antitoxin [Actinomycetota bacterium]|nr:type II toxin-antitoxin system VapB family antitoxin [Actinomycetota bacterium]
MSRTNIEIDVELIERVMSRYGFRTKREAVDRALRMMVDGIEAMTHEEIRAMRGTGWGEDGLELSDIRDREPIEEL